MTATPLAAKPLASDGIVVAELDQEDALTGTVLSGGEKILEGIESGAASEVGRDFVARQSSDGENLDLSGGKGIPTADLHARLLPDPDAARDGSALDERSKALGELHGLPPIGWEYTGRRRDRPVHSSMPPSAGGRQSNAASVAACTASPRGPRGRVTGDSDRTASRTRGTRSGLRSRFRQRGPRHRRSPRGSEPASHPRCAA